MASGKPGKDSRQDRLSALLRSNLQKRKAQMRARRNADEQAREGIPEDISERRTEKPQKDE